MPGLNERLLPIYRVESPDDVMRLHKEAMACRDLELILGVGVLLFNHIRSRHEAWFKEVQLKSTPYRVEEAELFANEYREWKEMTESWLSCVKQFETQGYDVENAGIIRGFYNQLSLVDLDVRGVLRTFEELERGVGQTLNDFFDGLPNSDSE